MAFAVKYHKCIQLEALQNTFKRYLENPGIDPGTSHMLSERSTIWANSPLNDSIRATETTGDLVYLSLRK